MYNYQQLKDEIDKNQVKLYEANKKSVELDTNSNNIQDIINNLKTNIVVGKDKYILKSEDKDKYKEFSIDLYEQGAIDKDTLDDLKKSSNKEKDKDDFEL